MAKMYDGIPATRPDLHRLSNAVDSLRDLAAWLAIHPHVPHPKFEMVSCPADVVMDLLDDEWQITASKHTTFFCMVSRMFGPFKIILFTEATMFGSVRTIDGEDRFVPDAVPLIIRNRERLLQAARNEENQP